MSPENPTVICGYCGKSLPPGARLCAECSNYRSPDWVARLRSWWAVQLLRVGVAGVALWLVAHVYQQHAESLRGDAARAQKIAESAMRIQALADTLRRPCLLDSDAACAARFEKALDEFTSETYAFKASSKELFGPSGTPIGETIDFIDDFFNPEVLPEAPTAVAPLQLALLENARFLSRRFDPARWCSPEGRARVRALMLSIDVYRYCYKLVRRYAAELGNAPAWTSLPGLFGRFEPAVTKHEHFPLCSRRAKGAGELERKADEIANAIERLTAKDSAPWLYDSFCPESISSTTIPPSTRQLVVVVSGGWTAQSGTARRFERAADEWRQVGTAVPVTLGRNGMGWGRGVHPVLPAALTSSSAAYKREGDDRSPAGMFTLGPVLAERPSPLAVRVRPITRDLICEDREGEEGYNTVRSAPAVAERCRDGGPGCPEVVLRDDGLYRRIVWVNHNSAPPSPGHGSCIFLHRWRGPGEATAGCTALAPEDLDVVIRWLDDRRRPMLVQLPLPDYDRHREAWGLPTLGQDVVASEGGVEVKASPRGGGRSIPVE